MNNKADSKEALINELICLKEQIASLEKEKQAMQQAHDFLVGIVDSLVNEGVIAVNPDNKIILFNPGAERLLGYQAENVIGKISPYAFHLPEELEQLRTLVKTKLGLNVSDDEIFGHASKLAEGKDVEMTLVRKDGSHLKALVSMNTFYNKRGEKIGHVGIINDLTQKMKLEAERQKLEDQLHQAQKMEAIGTLAGGIAHDFNNILSIILGYADLAEDEIPEDSPARSGLNHISKAARRAKDLVQQILTFSRQAEYSPRPLKLAALVEEAVKMLRSTLSAAITIQLNISPDTGMIMADPSRIHQVIMNLCVNAAQAMKEEGGTLTITLERVSGKESINDAFTLGHPMEQAEYLKLTVTDTGPGIPPENLSRIFDPYFTTKPKEEGSGLGLAVVHGIIKKHEGEIAVRSKPGEGASFSIFLPKITSEVAEATEVEEAQIKRGQEHILLVDDEMALAETGRLQLEKLGYRVTARTSSVDALEYFRKQNHTVDLVLTDLNMPNMSGLRLTSEIHRLRPDMPVVLLTGFSESIDEDNLEAQGIAALIMKPFVRHNLSSTIRQILDKKKSLSHSQD